MVYSFRIMKKPKNIQRSEWKKLRNNVKTMLEKKKLISPEWFAGFWKFFQNQEWKKIIQKIEDDDNTRDLPWEKISYFFLLHKNYKKIQNSCWKKIWPKLEIKIYEAYLIWMSQIIVIYLGTRFLVSHILVTPHWNDDFKKIIEQEWTKIDLV